MKIFKLCRFFYPSKKIHMLDFETAKVYLRNHVTTDYLIVQSEKESLRYQVNVEALLKDLRNEIIATDPNLTYVKVRTT